MSSYRRRRGIARRQDQQHRPLGDRALCRPAGRRYIDPEADAPLHRPRVDEAAELGPLLNKVSYAVTEITCADQVYSCLWSHPKSGPRHIHFVLQPVRNDQRASYSKGGPFIQTAMFEANEDHDPIAVEEFCDRAKDWFAAHS